MRPMSRRKTQKNSKVAVVRKPRELRTEATRLDSELFHVFTGLASLLLRHGYGFNRASHIARTAFVSAARQLSNQEGSKLSIARIATLTDLTRTEVSKLIRSGDPQPSGDYANLNRATRVADGWRSDRQFVDGNRQPKALQFGSFSHLVRKYSGDIPARAMLIEMVRLRMVRRLADDSIHLIKRKPNVLKSTVDAVRAISPWVELLSEFTGPSLTATSTQIRVYLQTLPQALAAARELEYRKNSFKEAIEQLGSTTSSSGAYELKISIALATEHPRKIGSRANRRKQK